MSSSLVSHNLQLRKLWAEIPFGARRHVLVFNSLRRCLAMNLSKCFLNHVNTSPWHTVARSPQMNSALYWEFLPVVLNNPACQLWLVPLYYFRTSTRQWCSLLALLLRLFLILQTPSKNYTANSQLKNSALLRQTTPIYTSWGPGPLSFLKMQDDPWSLCL